MSRQEEQQQYTPDTFKLLLKKLTQAPDDFTADDVAQCFRHLCRADGNGATEAQVRSDRLMVIFARLADLVFGSTRSDRL